MMASEAPAGTPVHLWIVGVVSLLWNAFGAYDYVVRQSSDAADGYPAWMHAAWALGVWGAILGSLLLLIRSRFAVWSFAVSLAGLLVATFYNFVIAPVSADMASGMDLSLTIAIWVVAIALLVYAWRMQAKGVLR
jgi:hypothetical protein